jgi:hypothetical protein
MKTKPNSILARLTGITMGVAVIVAMAGEIKADELIFKGGAQKLMNAPSSTVIPSDAKAMACAKCTTEWVERSIVATKATAPTTELFARHLCNACETTITVEGHGKAKHDVATHKCTSCGADTLACCSTKKGDVTATKGMEKEFEVAPLK